MHLSVAAASQRRGIREERACVGIYNRNKFQRGEKRDISDISYPGFARDARKKTLEIPLKAYEDCHRGERRRWHVLAMYACMLSFCLLSFRRTNLNRNSSLLELAWRYTSRNSISCVLLLYYSRREAVCVLPRFRYFVAISKSDEDTRLSGTDVEIHASIVIRYVFNKLKRREWHSSNSQLWQD